MRTKRKALQRTASMTGNSCNNLASNAAVGGYMYLNVLFHVVLTVEESLSKHICSPMQAVKPVLGCNTSMPPLGPLNPPPARGGGGGVGGLVTCQWEPSVAAGPVAGPFLRS